MSVYDNGLIAYYPFDGNLRDASGNQYDAIGSSLAYQTGKHSEGVLFDGNSSYVQLPDACSVKGLAVASICLWFKPAALTQTDDTLLYVEYTSSSSYTRFGLEITPDYKISFLGRDTNNGSILKALGQTALELDQWYLICGVYDSDNNKMSLYINGVLDGELSGGFGTFTATASADFSRLMRPSANRFVPGMIDEFSLWNKALTAAEVVELYNNGNGLFYGEKQPNDFFNTYPPISVMHMNDGTDAMNTAYNFTIYGEPDFAAGKHADAAGGFSSSNYLSRRNSVLNGVSAFVASLWIRPLNTVSTYQMIYASAVSTGTNGVEIYMNSNDKLIIEGRGINNQEFNIASAQSVTIGEWSHIIVGLWDNKCVIVINGVIEWFDTAIQRITDKMTIEIIGNVPGLQRPFSGQVDEFYLWDGMVIDVDSLADVVNRLYNNGNGLFYEKSEPATGSALALLPSGILPQAGTPGVIIGNYFIPMAKPQSGGNDENTRLMLHFDGDIVDNAKGNATSAELTLVNTSVDTENIKFGTGSGKVDAGQIKVQIPDIDLSTVNFVIEGWYYFSSSQSMNHSEQLMNQDFNNNGGWYARRLRDYPARVVLGARGHGDSGTYGTIALGAWNHIAVVKYSARILRLYINGVFAVEYDKSATAIDASIIGVIGPCYHDSSNPDLNEPTTGNVDEARLQIIPADEILQWTGQVIPIPEKPYKP